MNNNVYSVICSKKEQRVCLYLALEDLIGSVIVVCDKVIVCFDVDQGLHSEHVLESAVVDIKRWLDCEVRCCSDIECKQIEQYKVSFFVETIILVRLI